MGDLSIVLVPLYPPAMSVYATGPDSLLIQWEILPVEKARGRIIEHRIWYMEASNEDNAILVRYKMVLLPFHVYNYTHIRHYSHRDMHSI